MPSFQATVHTQQAPAAEGDFAGHNPRAVVLAGPGGLVAASEGLWIGRFAWLDWRRVDADNAPAVVTSAGTGPVAGFIHREQQGIITAFLGSSSMRLNGGFPVTVFSRGDFWALNRGTFCHVGDKAFARLADGAVLFSPTGVQPAASTLTGVITAATFVVTGSITNNILTVTGVTSGTVVVGATLAGTGIDSGTKITQQLTNLANPGGTGTYAVSIPAQNVGSTTINGTYGLLTASGVTGTIVIGARLAGTGITVPTWITALGPSVANTYVVTPNTAVASTAMTATTTVETDWYAATAGDPNELVKISSWAAGFGGTIGPADPVVVPV